MGAESELLQSGRVKLAGGIQTTRPLKLLHGVYRIVVPLARWSACENAFLRQRFLNLADPFGSGCGLALNALALFLAGRLRGSGSRGFWRWGFAPGV